MSRSNFAVALCVLALAACGGTSGDPPPAGGAAPVGITAPHASDQVLLALEHPDDDDEINDLLHDLNGLTIERLGTSSFFLLTLPAGTDLAALLDSLGDDVRVVEAEPNYVGRSPEGGPAGSAVLGSDLIDQISIQPGLGGLDLVSAHPLSTGAGVVVAVVDTGVDATHPYLAARIEPGGHDFIDNDADPSEERNLVDDDGDGIVDRQYGHGTFVASMVVAVAPDARILPVRVLDDEGFGTASTVAAGILWAVEAGAQVINVSVDIPDASDVVKEAISLAHDRDVLVVAAAGNDAANDILFPARFSGVVGVAAVAPDLTLAPFSNNGSHVALAAPGVDLIGAVPLDLNPPGTARWSGTSFATPLVAGAAALVRGRFPGDARDKVLDRLQRTAQSLDALDPAHAGRLGSGLVQPAPAVQQP